MQMKVLKQYFHLFSSYSFVYLLMYAIIIRQKKLTQLTKHSNWY